MTVLMIVLSSPYTHLQLIAYTQPPLHVSSITTIGNNHLVLDTLWNLKSSVEGALHLDREKVFVDGNQTYPRSRRSALESI